MLKWFLGILIFLYLLLCIVLYVIQGRLILWSDKTAENHKYRVGQEVKIKGEDDIEIYNLWIQSQVASKGVILYFHGNKGNINRALYQIRTFLFQDYDIFITDYRGYGKSQSTLHSDKEMYADAQVVYDYLKKQFKESEIHILGYSLGTGVASNLASKNNPKHLFLVAPFTSLTAIKDKYLWFLPDFLLRFQLPNKKHLPDVQCPVSILHGTNDEIVDYEFAKELKNMYPDKINLVTSEGQGHRGIIFDPMLAKEVRRVLNGG